jgi:hypothetical protein
MSDRYSFSRTSFVVAVQRSRFGSMLQLSRHLNMSPGMLYRFADGQLPTQQRRQQIAEALNVPESDLWSPCACTHHHNHNI